MLPLRRRRGCRDGPQIVGTAFADLGATSAKRIVVTPGAFCRLVARKRVATKEAQPLFSGCEFGDQRSAGTACGTTPMSNPYAASSVTRCGHHVVV